MAGSEAFALIIMGGASYALIRAFDFILRNLSNTLDYRAGNLANRDRDTTPWGDVVRIPAEMRPVGKWRAGERPIKTDGPVTNALNTQHNNSSFALGQGDF